MITLTELARNKIRELMAEGGKSGSALRFAVDGRGPGGFRYRLAFAKPEEKRPDDHVVNAGEFEVWIDQASAGQVKGVSIDYVETLMESGFRIDNPNSAWSDPAAAAVQRLLDDEINPAVASHGGYVTLLDVKDGVVYLELSGGCQGCGMANVTLREGIESRIREAVPGIREIVDTTDHTRGENPYYGPAEGGASPLQG